jgi:methyl-accepting chemotaxis protein
MVADQSASAKAQQLKFRAADVNGWQNAYALDAASGKAVDDTSGSRKIFLDAADAFRRELAAVVSDQRLSAYAADIDRVRRAFDRFMALDARIVELYRAETASARTKATDLVQGAEIRVFQELSAAADRLKGDVAEETTLRGEKALSLAQTRRIIVLGVALLALAVTGLLATLMTRSMTGPLQRTVGLLREVASGDLRGRMQDPSADELGQMGTALNETLARMSDTVDGIDRSSSTLSSASEQLSAVSLQMSAAAEETAVQAGSVSVGAEQVSNNVQSVSAGAEELGASIAEIARNTSEAAQVAGQAVHAAKRANTTVLRLGTSSMEIGEVVKVITSIAEQTNLLALNATIEAARAGDFGKGFAVVAGEVKDLARKTATSSEEIGRKIGTIQADTAEAVEAIAQITEIIQRINEIQTVIAAAVEQQAMTTNEIGRSVTEAAGGAGDIARNITGVAETARSTTQGANETHHAAEELSRLAAELLGLVRRFTLDSRTPAVGASLR